MDRELVTNYVPSRNFKESGNAVIDAAGVAQIDINGPKPGYLWKIERITVKTTNSLLTPQVDHYAVSSAVGSGQESGEDEFDNTPQGTLNVSDEFSPPVIHEGENIRTVWSGGTAGGLCTVRLQIQEYFIQTLEVPRHAVVSMIAQGTGDRR